MRLIVTFSFLILGACAHDQAVYDNNVAKSEDGKLQSQLEWVKVKRGKLDFLVVVENEGEESVYWEQNSTIATYGDSPSSVIIHGNKGQVIPAGGAVRQVVTLGFGEPYLVYSKGTLKISPVYDYTGGKKGKKLGVLEHQFEVKEPMHHR